MTIVREVITGLKILLAVGAVGSTVWWMVDSLVALVG